MKGRCVMPPHSLGARHQQSADPPLHHRRADARDNDGGKRAAYSRARRTAAARASRHTCRRPGEADRRRLMQRVPPIHAELDDRQVHHAHQRQDRPRPIAACTSSNARTSAICPRYRKNRISTEVSRASQTHQAPHIGLPHRLPVARHSAVKPAPTGPIPPPPSPPADAATPANSPSRPQGQVAGRGQPGRRHMHIHDPHRVALLPVGRRDEQPPHQAYRHEAKRPARRPWQHGAGGAQKPPRDWRTGAASAPDFCHSGAEQ